MKVGILSAGEYHQAVQISKQDLLNNDPIPQHAQLNTAH